MAVERPRQRPRSPVRRLLPPQLRGDDLGPFINLVPAHADLYFRRFNMGVQLAGIYLAGAGVIAAWGAWWRLVSAFASSGRVYRGAMGCFVAALAAWSYPAVHQVYDYDRSDASTIDAQRTADATDGALLEPLLRYLTNHGNGRVYAGQSSNWGQKLLVGYVPVYKYLVTQDVEESTYLVPTSSLMLGAEADFDVGNPADYSLFGIRYLLLPTGMSAPVPAREVMVSGTYSLWRLDQSGAVARRERGRLWRQRHQRQQRLRGTCPGHRPDPRQPGRHRGRGNGPPRHDRARRGLGGPSGTAARRARLPPRLLMAQPAQPPQPAQRPWVR